MITNLDIKIAIFIIFVALLLFYTNWKINRYVLFLSFYLLFTSFTIIFYDLIVTGGSKELFLIMLSTSKPIFLLSGPSFYFFIRGMLDDEYHFNGKKLVHIIPSLLSIILIIPYLLLPLDAKLSYVDKVMGNLSLFMSSSLHKTPNWIAIQGCILFSTLYILKSLWIIIETNRKKIRLLQDSYGKQYKRNYVWFLLITLVALAMNIFHIGLSLYFLFNLKNIIIFNFTFSHIYLLV